MRLGLMLMAFAIATAGSETRGTPSRKVCWPLHFAGLTVGLSNEAHMRRLLGNGVFRGNEGDTGGRVVIDAKKTATLHAEFHTDKVIGELTLSTGIGGLSDAEQKAAVSEFFDPREGFGNWHALRLGSTKKEVLANLGSPESGVSTEEWRYSTACVCELDENFTITFKGGRIVRVVFTALPG